MSFKTRNRNGTRQKTKSQAEVENGTAGPVKEKALQRVTATGDVGPPNNAEAMAEARKMLAQASGVKDPDLAARIIDQVSLMQAVWPFGMLPKQSKLQLK